MDKLNFNEFRCVVHRLFLLLGIVLLMSSGAVLAQAEGEVLPEDTTGVVLDSLQSMAVDSLAQDSLVEIVMEEDSSSGFSSQDSLSFLQLKQIALLQNMLDSLQQNNRRLKAAADRRLTMDTFVDSFRNYLFYSCVINPHKVSIQLHNRLGRKRVHTFSSLDMLAQDRGGSLVFAMNAGMYKPNRLAKGLLIVDGKQQQKLDLRTEGYGNFYMQPNGVFALDTSGQAYVLPTQHFPALADTTEILCATQSGPMMVIDGMINDKFNDGSPNRHIRNAVGVTPDNQVVFAISRRPVTFFELSSFMIQQGCTNALYLDGAISQAYLPEIGIGSLEAGRGLGPIFVIMQ